MTETLPAKQDDAAFIKNKVVQVLIGLLRHEYPAHWPSFFADLIATMERGPIVVDMFLRVLHSLNEEVIVSTSDVAFANTVVRDWLALCVLLSECAEEYHASDVHSANRPNMV